MDRIDRVILSHLQADATLSVGELAELASVSKSACWRRIQKLESGGIIQRRVTLLDAAALDLPLTVFISIRTNQHNENWAAQFKAVVQDIAGILEVYRMAGELDYLVKAVVKDMSDYDKLYQRLIGADLFDVTSNFVMEKIKSHYTVATLSSGRRTTHQRPVADLSCPPALPAGDKRR